MEEDERPDGDVSMEEEIDQEMEETVEGDEEMLDDLVPF